MSKSKIGTGLLLVSVALTLCWCPLARAKNEQPIQLGEKVRLNYLCRLKDGAVAATTYRDTSLSPDEKRSPIYLSLKNDAPLELAAGQPTTTGAPSDFADVIVSHLGQAAVGLSSGKMQTVNISAQQVEARPNGTINLAKVRRRPKEMRLTVAEYQQHTGKEPEVGQNLTFDPAIPGQIVSVKDQEVLVRFKAPVGKNIDTPFGAALVKADDRSYLLEIQVQKGDLVRSGPMVGRIIEVKEQTFTIDYGHPIAGEDLHCEVTVERNNDIAHKEHKL